MRTASWTAAPVVVAALPLLAVLVHALSQIHRAPLEAGDYALLEMGARSALHGVQRLGPYSRFGWDHPGPATFYWSAPVYALSDQRPEGLAVATLIANLAVIVAIVVVARRAAGIAGGWAAAGVTLFMIEVGGAAWLDHPWNPLTVILPLTGVAVLGAGAAGGVTWTLPVAMVAASYALQTHVGTAPVLGLFVLVLGPLVAWRWRRSRVPWRKPVVAALVVLAVMWTLPVVQQVSGRPGNLSVLWDFFNQHSGSNHSLKEAVRVTVPQLTLTRGRIFGSLTRPTGYRLSTWTSAKMIILLAGVALGVVLNLLRRRWFCMSLCIAALAGAVGAVLAAERVVGDLFGYLTSSALAVGLVLFLAIVATISAELAALVRRWPDAVRLTLIAAVVASLACSSVLLASRSAGASLFAPAAPNPTSVHLLTHIRLAARARPGRAVYIDPQVGTRTWSIAALVANQLERDGLVVRTPKAWEFMFGARRTGLVGRATHIQFIDTRKGPLPAPPARFLGEIGFTRAYVLG